MTGSFAKSRGGFSEFHECTLIQFFIGQTVMENEDPITDKRIYVVDLALQEEIFWRISVGSLQRIY